MTDEVATTLCEGCGEEVPGDEVQACEFCELDPLCNNCVIPEEHSCPGKPGEPGSLTLEVGQRVQDKFQMEKTDVGRIVSIEDDFVHIWWAQPSFKQSPITKAQATALLENSNIEPSERG